MIETGAKPRRLKLWKYLLFVVIGGTFLLAGLGWYATTDSFQALVRRRVVTELQQVTGGRVDLGGLHTTPFRLRVEVQDLTIHGREAAGEVPYAHVGRLIAQIKIISLLETQFGFTSLVLDHPVVHIIVYPDGTTNQPVPQLQKPSGKTSLQQFFALSIRRLEVRHGELIWADQRIPLDFAANDVSADMSYSFLRRRFDGNLLLGKVDTIFDGYRPVAWTAEVHFSLGRNSIAVNSLKATSGRSRLEGHGQVGDLRRPKIDADYDLILDLEEAAAITRRMEVRGGVLQAGGHGSWTAKDFSSTGKIALKDFEYRDKGLNLRRSSMNAQFTLDPRRLALSQIQARTMGGSVSGDAEFINWLSPAPPGKAAREKNSEEQLASLRLKMRDISAAEIAATLETAGRPLHLINLAAVASGTVDARWVNSLRNLIAEVTLDTVPSPQKRPTQLPLTAHFRGAYRAATGELEVTDLDASTRATRLHASGTLSSSAAVKLSLNTSDLGEWYPILTGLGYTGHIPVVLHGHAFFSGNATGKLSNVAFAGNIQAQDFDVMVPATTRTPAKQVHWDALAADILLSPQNFSARNGTLHHGEGAITFNLAASLHERRFTDTSSFTAQVDIHDADAAEVMSLAGYDYPISGHLNLSGQVAGTVASPHGQGQVQLTQAMIYGEPIERFSSGLRFSNGQAEANDILVSYRDSRVTGDATYDLSSRTFRFNLAGVNFDLAHIPQVQTGHVAVEGRMDFTAVGSGTLDEPIVNAAIRLHDLTLDHERAGDFTIDAVTQGPELKLTGRSQFEHAELDIDGKVNLRGDWPANLTLHFNHLDIDALLRTYLRGHVTGHSATVGDLQIDGPLLKPGELHVTGNLSDLFADVENFKVHSNGPIRFSVSSQSLNIEQFRLLGEGTDLSVNGTVHLTGDRELDLRARGSTNLKLIESFDPDFTTAGVATVDMTVSGTVAKPLAQGRLQVTAGSIAYSDLPSALSDVNGSLVFSQDRVQIETLTAHTGGGLVTLAGYATSYKGELSFNVTVQGQDVRLRYPPGISSTATADLHFVGTTAASTLSGDITVNKLTMTPGFDFGAYLARSSQTNALPQTNPLLNQIRLDVHILTAPELQMQTAIVRLSGDADLRLRGTAAKPVLIGRADVIEGEVYFNGSKYRLERGDVTFTNPVSTDPVLDLQASTRVRDYDITLNLNGKVDKLNVTYRSEPPLPTSDIIALLALGRTTEESAQLQQSGSSPFSQEASSAILSAALNATVTNRVQHLFGISRIKIDPQGLNTETSTTQTGPAVTIEQQVANNLTITYSTSVSQTSQQVIQVEYNLSRNVSLVGLRDQNGVVSFDVRIRRRKK